jgi:hypothetical protein
MAAVLAARRAVTAKTEDSAKERFASGTPARPNGAPTRPQTAAAAATGAVDVRESGAFAAQRLAQEAEPDAGFRARPSSAAAAYLRTRDSHIQILPSIEALDLRV